MFKSVPFRTMDGDEDVGDRATAFRREFERRVAEVERVDPTWYPIYYCCCI